MLSKVSEYLLLVFLIAGVPTVSYRTVRPEKIRGLPRSAIYFSAAISQWLLTAVVVAVVRLASPTFSGVGFRSLAFAVFLRWTAGLTFLSLMIVGLLLVLERRGWWPQESEIVYLLMPETRVEKLWSVLLLAPTAALCEEFLYRGYLLGQLSQRLHSAAWGVGASSLAFGLAHLYQGFGGSLRASLLGFFLAFSVISTGSLYPSMAGHFAIDAVALMWLGPKFLPRATPS